MTSGIAPRCGIGFASLLDEVSRAPLTFTGTVPLVLAGTMYRIGPGRFQIGDHAVGHWLDGFALVSSITLSTGGATFSNRFLGSSWYRRALTGDAVPPGGFDSKSVRRGVHALNDNANLNITSWRHELEAHGDTSLGILIDPLTLATIRTRRAPRLRRCCATSPHPVLDENTAERFDLSLCNGDPPGYVVTVTSADGKTRVLGTVPSPRLGYMHSFSVTQRWVVLIEGPFTARPHSLSSTTHPYLRNYVWDAGRGTRIMVMDRNTGGLKAVLAARPLFPLHHINAWDDGERVFVDVAAYADPSILDSLAFDHGDVPAGGFPAPLATRLVIDLEHERVLCLPLRSPPGEFCAIDARFSKRQHTVLFAAGPTRTGEPIDRLCRSDLTTGQLITWASDNCFPGSPVFVPAGPDSTEGEGWLLSIVLDVQVKRSFLLILDAATMTECARAWLPCAMPFGLHSLFVPEEAAT